METTRCGRPICRLGNSFVFIVYKVSKLPPTVNHWYQKYVGGLDDCVGSSCAVRGLLCCTPAAHPWFTRTLRDPKLYGCYACYNAQHKGWKSCERKSVLAPMVETAVLASIRALGRVQRTPHAGGRAEILGRDADGVGQRAGSPEHIDCARQRSRSGMSRAHYWRSPRRRGCFRRSEKRLHAASDHQMTIT